MKWGAKRLNRFMLLHNHLYFGDFALGILFGYTDMGFEVQIDLIFFGITIFLGGGKKC